MDHSNGTPLSRVPCCRDTPAMSLAPARLAGEDQQTVVGHVHGQIHENVDLVVTNQGSDFLVRSADDIPPDVGAGPHLRCAGIRIQHL